MSLFRVAICLVTLNFLTWVQASTCNSNMILGSPDSRFVLHGNGTATDTLTGLVWARCSLGQVWSGTSCSGESTTLTWQEALKAAHSSEFAGDNSWRLPNFKELASILDKACYNPALNDTTFPQTPSLRYWSSSPFLPLEGTALSIDFNEGAEQSVDTDQKLVVRLVRASL